MKKELLLPAGSMDALKYAVHNGADAVYLGGKKFGARAFANNFTDEELVLAVKYCHLYDVKIYITVNTILFERELEEVLAYIDYLYNINVDALIICDLGLISVVHKKYPDLELHLSTQAHTFSINQMYFWKDLGIKRVVVDRELSLNEIKHLPDILEIEVFIHGALCVSYSGLCYMSFRNLVRSGNRGSCAQLCRMPYELIFKGKKVDTEGIYLLSTKELNASRRMQELLNSNIKSFKIEGRMKSPEYVGFIARFYRNIIDGNKIEKEDEKKLRFLFHREFTEGYLFDNQNIMNIKTSNHQGNVIGKVVDVTPSKIKIKLEDSVTQEDGIRFEKSERGMIINYLYDEKELLIHEANKGDTIYVDNKIGLKERDVVRKTIDKKLIDSLKKYPEKKIPIMIDITIKYPTVSITLKDNHYTVCISRDIVEESKKVFMKEEEIKKQVLKLGNTPFICKCVSVNLTENIFIPVSKLNELRRDAISELWKKRECGQND